MTQADNEANEKHMKNVMTSGTWIDKTFLEEVIEGHVGTVVNIVEFDIKPAVGAGDNYLSVLYRTAVKYVKNRSDKEEEIHLIIKGEPTAEFFIQFVEEMGIFTKELTMYKDCLPKLNKEQEKHFPNDTPLVAPTMLKCSRNNTIVMTDLSREGYKMANRRNQLDFQHSAETLKTLARFHALSVKVHGENPEIVQSVTKEFYLPSNEEKMSPFLADGLNLVANVHEKIHENARFAKTLRGMTKYIWRKLLKLVAPTEKFNVLNHGDLWTNNILFKYNEDGSVLNAKLVDFQLSRYCSPAVDLHYFLYTSTQPDVLKNKMSDLLLLYHDTLMKSLTALQLKIDYSFEDLLDDMHEKAAYAVISIIQIVPVCLAAPSEKLNLDDVKIDEIKTGDDNPMKSKYEDPTFVKVSGEYFSHLESMGYLSDAISRLQPFVDELDAKNNSTR